MDFELSEEVRMVRNSVRHFVERELLPLEPLYEFEEYSLPEEKRGELVQKAKDAGLWGLHVPEEYGGPEDIGFIGRVAVQEEIFRTLVGHSAFGTPVFEGLFLCSAGQKAKYLVPALLGERRVSLGITEPGSGADPSMMATWAEERSGSYVINGRKTFITGADQCDFMMLYARLKGTEGREGITCFLVDSDKPGFTIERRIPVMAAPTGSMSESPCEVTLEDVEVSREDVLGEPGKGWSILQSSLGGVRLGFGARCLALASRCLDMARDYAVDRVTFGRPLADRQAVQWPIADSAIAIENLRWMTYHAAWKLDHGRDARTEISMLKVFASETLERVADRAIQIHGALGLSRELPLEQIYRAARVDRIVDGPNEVHRFVIARNVLRGHWLPGI